MSLGKYKNSLKDAFAHGANYKVSPNWVQVGHSVRASNSKTNCFEVMILISWKQMIIYIINLTSFKRLFLWADTITTCAGFVPENKNWRKTGVMLLFEPLTIKLVLNWLLKKSI